MKASPHFVLALSICAFQPLWAQSFPEGATTPTAADIKQRLDDRVFDVKLADGTSWRLEFNSRGHFFINVSNGFNGKGDWRPEDGKICSQPPGRAWGCNDVRLFNNILHLKRDSGEIVRYLPR